MVVLVLGKGGRGVRGGWGVGRIFKDRSRISFFVFCFFLAAREIICTSSRSFLRHSFSSARLCHYTLLFPWHQIKKRVA